MQTEQNKVVVRGLIQYLLRAIWNVTRICPTMVKQHLSTLPDSKTVVLVDKAFIRMYLDTELYDWKLW